MNRKLLLRCWEKNKIYLPWKKEQATWGEYKEVTRIYREKIRTAKAQLEFNLTTLIKDNTLFFYYFYKYTNSKRKAMENLHPSLDSSGIMTTEDKEKFWVYHCLLYICL